jgi:DNA (cytosine-5)-methyltransferase 1
MERPGFYEFFAGGGMARAGLEGWRCLFANDFDPKKAAAYRLNWGEGEMHEGDIHALAAADLPGAADLAWASFPCQDLSLAGAGKGLNGARSGAFFGFRDVVAGLRREGRAPALLVVENVVGALTSNEGRDFATLAREIAGLGYVFGALVIDAQHFLPQSRPRLFVIALDAARVVPEGLAGAEPDEVFATAAVRRAHAALPADLRARWRWWRLPAPPQRNLAFADLIEEAPADVAWHRPQETQRLISLMSPLNRAKLDAAKKEGGRQVGAVYRRTRHDADGRKAQRAEARFDGLAGCLRTPGGGSSRQFILVVEGRRLRSRLLSSREAARLMGLPEDYRLPASYNEAYHLIGDGLAAPAVRFLSDHLLLPLARAASAPRREGRRR